MNFETEINFEPSKAGKHTEDILRSRPQVTRRQWVRYSKCKFIRPQILQKKPSRIVDCYLVEFSDPG